MSKEEILSIRYKKIEMDRNFGLLNDIEEEEEVNKLIQLSNEGEKILCQMN